MPEMEDGRSAKDSSFSGVFVGSNPTMGAILDKYFNL